ncbi:hypothetical protein E2C01_026207 [Portunus trituberculatus]|uniref:Secreted protein n=1 Tax=Portunus trituberculatus TaxID=210409 RepID=A0A5B7EHK2_PORTR|nr:hypothetical protein [Portunus trituberculatus]
MVRGIGSLLALGFLWEPCTCCPEEVSRKAILSYHVCCNTRVEILVLAGMSGSAEILVPRERHVPVETFIHGPTVSSSRSWALLRGKTDSFLGVVFSVTEQM